MRYPIILGLMLLASCSTYPVADEPADLVAPGRKMPELLQMGWKISEPIQATQAGLPEAGLRSLDDGQTWAVFIAKLGPSDELRRVHNNAGNGYAIFHDGKLTTMFLTTVF